MNMDSKILVDIFKKMKNKTCPPTQYTLQIWWEWEYKYKGANISLYNLYLKINCQNKRLRWINCSVKVLAMGKRHWTLITFLINFNWFLIALICNSASVLKRRVIISVNFHHDKNIVWFHPHICNDNDGRIYHPSVVQFLISIDHVHFPKWMS